MARDRIALLDWPTGFGSPARKPVVYFAIPFFSLAAIFFAVELVRAISAADALSIVFHAGGMAVSAGFVAAFTAARNVRQASLPPKLKVTETGTGRALTMPMSRPFTISLLTLLVSGTVFLLAYALSLFLRDDRSGAAQLRDYLFGVVLIVTSAVMVWLAVYHVTNLRRESPLVISSEGIEMDNGSVHQRLPWTAIETVDASANNNNPALIIRPSASDELHTFRSSVIVRKLSRNYLRAMIIDVHFYRIDPALLYHLIHFYWKHPELRSELSTNTVIDRLRRGNLSI
ncbi:hypothetical protein [Nocardia wallacei]|uniref:hypothetical protein n=1 Tax=Nocardia wallacei TaxID=480035 RepID=UPI0024552034|nr:hypothetical protein [Nocardia wallacei]